MFRIAEGIMTTHEKDLLVILSGMLLLMGIGVLIAAQTLGTSLLFVLYSAIKSLGGKIVIFVLLGLGLMVYEITTMSDRKNNRNVNKLNESITPGVLGGSIGLVIVGLFLSLPRTLGQRECNPQ
jgi:hypothetical protein